MTTATVSAKGWVVIPKKYRKKYGFRPSTKVRFNSNTATPKRETTDDLEARNPGHRLF